MALLMCPLSQRRGVRLGTRHALDHTAAARATRPADRARSLLQCQPSLLPAGVPDPEVIWCPLDPKPLPLNYRHEEETGLYYAGDYNLRGRTPKADVDVCFNGNIAISQVKLL